MVCCFDRKKTMEVQKMKKLKHVSIAVLLFVSLLTVMVGLGINAFSEGLEHSVADGKVTITKYEADAVIPTEIDGFTVTAIAEDAFDGCTDLADVYFAGDKAAWTALGFDFGETSEVLVHYNVADVETHRTAGETVAPNCKEQGYTKYTCNCGYEYERNYVAVTPNAHTYETTVTKAATCKDEGTKTHVCEFCGNTYSEKIERNPANHAGETVIKDAVDATCGKPGFSGNKHCADCDVKIEDGTETPATGEHTYDIINKSEVTIVPTCSEKGERIDECTVCGHKETVELDVDPANHVGTTKTERAKEPTCVAEGYTGDIYCLSCEVKIVTGKAIPATGEHDYKEEVTKVPTCCEKGEKTFTCSVCNGSYAKEIDFDAENHAEYGTELVGAEKETCGKDGYSGDTKCVGCKVVLIDGEVIKATGKHNYKEEVTKVATCKETGVKTFTCDVCTDSYTEDIEKNPENHADYGTKIVGAAENTCALDGYTGDTHCAGCDALFEKGEVVKATGKHNYISAVTTVANCHETGVKTSICSTCNGFNTEEIAIDPDNHDGETEIRKASDATCATPGYTGDTYCLGCDKELEKGSEIPATGEHNYKEEVAKAATCIATGEKVFTCAVCKDSYKEAISIDSTNHAGETEVRDAVAENCGVAGYTGDTYCLDCTVKIADGKEIPATGKHEYTSEVTTVPTCCEKGEKTFTCEVCNDVYTEEVDFDAENHAEYGTEIRDIVEGNCGKDGYTGNTYCKGCNVILAKGEASEATDNHNYVSAETKVATCCEYGEVTFICSVCSDFYTESTGKKNPLNHSGGTEIRDDYAETCGKDGYEGDIYCLGCGSFLRNGEVIPATGLHNFESKITTPATCIATGIKTFTCTVCEGYYTEDVAIDSANHIGKTEIRDNFAETCGTDGFTGNTYCLDCKTKIADGEKIPATGKHTLSDKVTKVAMCNEAGIRTYTCSVCAHTYDETIAKDPANHTGKTEIRDAIAETCGANGFSGNTHCSDCGTKIADGEVIPATGKHNYFAQITTPATCINTGVITCICTVCADTYYETIDVDANNHAGKTEIRDYVAENCGENGYSGDTYCLDCDTKIADGKVIVATGDHPYDSEITKVPTCCEKGEKAYTCPVCKSSMTEVVDYDAENHAEYGTEIRNDSEPKCVIKGYTGDTCCIGCGTVLETGEDIPETGKHDYASKVTVAATCCNAGVRTYTCIVCEDSFTEEIAKDAKNHEGETENRDSKEATCTAVGYTGDTYCKGCEAIIAEGTEIAKTAHTEVEVEGKEATCKATGLTKGSKCSVCDTVIVAQKVVAKLDHTFGDWTLVKAPTTAEAGAEERVCSACKTVETRPVEKLSYVPGDVNGDGQINAADARLILRVSASLDTLDGIGTTVEVADMNADGKVNAADARLVLRKAAKLD